MISPNAQDYSQTIATIMRMGIAQRERGCDPEKFDTRITCFGVMVEKI
jgi:hypothetical protein